MNYKDLNQLFGDNSYRFAGSAAAAERLRKRKWQLAGNLYTFAGIGKAKGEPRLRLEAHFTSTQPLEGGGFWHNRVLIDLGDALDCISGDLSSLA